MATNTESEIATFLNVERSNVESLAQELKDAILSKAEEFAQLQSDNLRTNVLLEETKANLSSKYEKLKEELDYVVEDNTKVRAENKTLSEKVWSLETSDNSKLAEINQLKTSNEGLQNNIDRANERYKELNTSYDEKVTELEHIRDEKKELQTQIKTLNDKILELELKCQEYQSSELNRKSELERNAQEILLLRKNQEWLEQELTNKNQHFMFYRKKTDLMVHDAVTNVEKLKSDLKIEKSSKEILSKKLDETTEQLQNNLIENKDLKDVLAVEKQEFDKELSIKDKLIKLYENQIKSLESTLQQKFKTAEANEENSSEVVKSLKEELSLAERKLQDMEEKCVRLESILDHDSNDISLQTKGRNRTYSNDSNSNSSDELGSFDDSSISLSRMQGDIKILKRQLVQEKRQKEKLQNQVESFVIELEHKIPVINSFQERTSVLEKELTDTALLLEHATKENELKTNELQSLKKKISDDNSQLEILLRQRTDLAHQLQYLLINISIINDNDHLLNEDEIKFIKNLVSNDNMASTNDSQKVISEHLIKFKDIQQLQEKNMELVKTVRTLAQQLEENEEKKKSTSNNTVDEDNEIFAEAKEAILTLEKVNENLEKNLQIVTKERDAFKLLVSEDRERNCKSSNSVHKYHELKSYNETVVKDLENRLTQLTNDSNAHSKALTEELNLLHKEISQLNVQIEKYRSAKSLAEERLKITQNSMELLSKENEQLRIRSSRLEDSLLQQDKETQKTFSSYVEAISKNSSLETSVRNLETEVTLLKDREISLKSELSNTTEEKTKLRIMVTQLQSLQSERETLLERVQSDFKKRISEVNYINEKLDKQLSERVHEIDKIEKERNAQYEWYQKKIDEASQQQQQIQGQLQTKNDELERLHLQNKTLEKELEGAQIRIHTYETINQNNSENQEENDVIKELEKTKIELADAYSQLEEFKNLSQNSEDALKELNASFNAKDRDYRDAIKTLTEEKTEIEGRFEILKQQLENIKNELTVQSEEAESERKRLTQTIAELQGAAQPIEEVKKMFEEKLQKLENDLEEQTVYANNAQKNYEQELQRHADVSKTISELREQNQRLKNDTKSLTAELQSLQDQMSQNEKHLKSERDEYRIQIDLAQQRIDDITKQNQLLYNQIDLLNRAESVNENSSDDEANGSTALVLSLRRERDILDTKINVIETEKNSLQQKLDDIQNELENTKRSAALLESEYSEHSDLINNYQTIRGDLEQLNLLRESNVTLRNELKQALDEKDKIAKDLQICRNELLPLQSNLESANNLIKEKDLKIASANDESQRWKTRLEEMIEKHQKVNVDDYTKLEETLNETKQLLDNKVQETNELNDRFNRLKKQAHEKLNTSKELQSSLQEQISNLISEKDDIRKQLDVKTEENSELLSELNNFREKQNDLETLREELNKEISKSEELEVKLQNEIESSSLASRNTNKEIEELQKVIDDLKTQLAANSTDADEQANRNVEAIKREFEDQKTKFIAEKTEEFNRRLIEETEKIRNEFQENEKPDTELNVDVEALRKQWEEDSEELIQKRIAEAEDNLKKRIRLPSEEKINKIIEKRRNELESEFDQKIRDKARDLLMNDHSNEFNNELKEALEKELKERFEDELQAARKKAFEEGKQQATMKTTLLERKIQKLESQIQEKDKDSEETQEVKPEENSTPSVKKIPETLNSSDTSFGNSNNVKVLKPSSPFGATSAFNNPFTFNNNGNPPAFASAFAPTFKDLMSGQGGQQSELSQNKRVGDDDIETNELKKSKSDSESDQSS
ncbi:Protein MLP1 [Nakaseomyces glabratus]|nr:Protein MLP1 [Nakaseomyces glabratus]KTB25233.1 Protein MLP1 [Nakaseomyces glabratus]